MLRLPLEIQLRILHLATHVPGLLEITPDPSSKPFEEEDALEALIKSFRESLKLRLALPLVSRELNALGTPILYECVHLYQTTPIADALATFTSSTFKPAMVRHVIIDVSPSQPEEDLAALIGLLSRVRILSVMVHRPAGFTEPPFYDSDLLINAMARALAPTLRRLVLSCYTLILVTPSTWTKFTKELVHLETLVSFAQNPGRHGEYHSYPIRFPDALPHLKTLQLVDTNMVRVGQGYTPTHLQCHLWSMRPYNLDALTHLDVHVSEVVGDFSLPVFDFGTNEPMFSAGVYPTLHETAPLLVSLALSGITEHVTCPLTLYTFPPTVEHLRFPSMRRGEENHGDDMFLDIYTKDWTAAEGQAWVDALVRLPASVRTVTVGAAGWMSQFLEWVDAGEVNADALLGCDFVLEDEEGEPLLEPAESTAAEEIISVVLSSRSE
ncbi:hypothetical protein OF83DRAFT_722875 [Amylostereum chailletii]|nr:hypothetical protein OF83DRAFT_722875 [Amylostereum chailletii]